MGMRADPLPRDKIRIVYVMAEVRRPVSRSLVADFTDQDPILVQNVIDEWQQFLHKQLVDGETRYSVYHSSFLDFLHDEEVVKAAGETIENINKHIASSLRNEWMKNA
jgi:serine/threonine-protein kinase